jgi:hypothetical protein
MAQQKHLEEKVKLQLDVKTRWNSIVHIVRIFMRYFKPIKAALIELGKDQC